MQIINYHDIGFMQKTNTRGIQIHDKLQKPNTH